MWRPAGKWTTLTRQISVRFFNFNDLSSQVGHEFGRIRSRHQVAQFEYAYPFESPHISSPFSSSDVVRVWNHVLSTKSVCHHGYGFSYHRASAFASRLFAGDNAGHY